MPSAERELDFSELSFFPDEDECDWQGDLDEGTDENDVLMPRVGGAYQHPPIGVGFFCPDCLSQGHYSWVELWERRCRDCGWLNERSGDGEATA